MNAAAAALPLARYKVPDLTIARAGPTAVRLLADWGADVIKIEPQPAQEHAGGSVTATRHGPEDQKRHRNKRGLCIALTHADGSASGAGQVVHALKTRSRDGATHEMSARRHLSREGAVLTMFRVGELRAQNPAAMNRLRAKDEPGHVAFGVMHMPYVTAAVPERREEIHG